MRIISGLYFFYQKLVIPSLFISFTLSYFAMGYMNFYAGVGISFIFITPTLHYFIYEVRTPNEYYFYYNLGLSKFTLWLTTISFSLIIGSILLML